MPTSSSPAFVSLRMFAAVAALFLSGVVFPARAANISWTNQSGGSWETPGNWSLNTTPLSTNRLFITNGNYTVRVNDATADNDPGGVASWMAGGATTAPALTIGSAVGAPTLIVDFTNSSKTLKFTSTTALNGGGGAIFVTAGSSLVVSNGTVEGYATTGKGLVISTNATVALHGIGATLRTTNDINVGSGAGAAGTLNVVGGALSVTGGVNLGTTAGSVGNLNLNGGSISIRGGSVVVGGVSGVASIGATGNLDVASGLFSAGDVTLGGGVLASGGGYGTWHARGSSTNVAATVTVGLYTNSVGRLYVEDTAVATFANLRLGGGTPGTVAAATGFVYVTGGSLSVTGLAENVFGPRLNSYGFLLVSNTGVADFRGGVSVAGAYAGSGGGIQVTGGRLTMGGVLTLGNAGNGAASVLGSGVLELESSLALAAGANSLSNLNGGTVRFVGQNAPTVTVGGGASLATSDATIEFKGASAFVTNALGKFSYTGSNTLSLVSATNASIGGFTVGSGQNFAALKVDSSSLWQSTNLTVAAGGTLSGPGNIGSVNVTNAGVISPGNSPGTLTFASNLTFMAGSVLNIELGGTNAADYDRLVALGGLTLGGTLNVTLVNGYTPTSGDTVDILDWGALLGGTFATVNLPSAEWTTASLYTDGTLLYAVIPEPGALALLSLAGLGWVLFRRRAP